MRKTLIEIEYYLKNLSQLNPLTNVYGIARSAIALSTFLSLAFNNTYTIFKPIAGVEDVPICLNEASYSFFCVFQDILPLFIIKFIALALLFLVIIGIYPRYTAIFHYWISLSFIGSATVIDGGDQVNTVLSLLLIPICILDNRKWVWQKESDYSIGRLNQYKNIFIWSCFTIIAIQVSLIYLNASIEKLKVPEWRNGTAVYYYFNSPTLGLSEFSRFFIEPIINNSIGVTLTTYLTMILELLLFCSLFMRQRLKYIMFFSAVFLHFMIILVHGLPTFFLAMLGALILFLIPKNKWINLNNWKISLN